MKDFFISYNKHDRTWAEWIAWELEEEGFTVIIQAWDFVGNWIVQMDQAMRTTKRTIAVLSPNYLDAAYTQSEWANAFRLDPTGKEDLLIPVRVADFQPDGIFAQLVYIDFVGQHEDSAKEQLLRRVRAERGKPATKPTFPTDTTVSQRVVTYKPVFPAKAEDDEKRQRIRDIVILWRGLYSIKINSLRKAGEQCRVWMDEPPIPFSSDMIQVLTLANTVTRHFQQLSLKELEYAQSYGLRVHLTVLQGQAFRHALRYRKLIDPEKRAEMIATRHIRQQYGIDDTPDKYDYEMLARLFESASSLAQFDISNLPGGYLSQSDQSIPENLSEHQRLLVAVWNYKPGLYILSVGENMKVIGSFFARKLALDVLCAQLNEEGSLDMVAQDDQHVYYWSRSGQQPVMQFAKEREVLYGRFLSTVSGSSILLIESGGDVRIISIDGKNESKPSLLYGTPSYAQAWIDPFQSEDWYTLALTWEQPFWSGMHVVSGRHGFATPTFSATDLWNQPMLYPAELFLDKEDPFSFWNSICSLNVTAFDGLPCAIAERQALWGTGICFLDPKTLVQLRRPLLIPKHIGGLVVAAGRWLLVTLTQYGPEIQNRIMVWDLRATHDDPVGSWLAERGDVYAPVIIAEDAHSFQTLQVLRQFDSSSDANYQLCRFHWPSGTIDRLDRYSKLQIWPVSV